MPKGLVSPLAAGGKDIGHCGDITFAQREAENACTREEHIHSDVYVRAIKKEQVRRADVGS